MHLLNSPCCAASATTWCSGITNQTSPVDKIVSSPDSTDVSEDGTKLSNLQQAAASVTASSATNDFAVSIDVQSRLPPSATTNSRTLLLAMGRKTRWICELCNIVFNSAQALGGHRSSSAEHRMRLSEAVGKVLPGRDNSGVFKDGGSSVAKRPKKQGDKKENKMAVEKSLPLRWKTAVSVDRVRRDDEEGRQGGEGDTGVSVFTKDVGVCARLGRRGLQMSSMIYIEAGNCGEVSICAPVDSLVCVVVVVVIHKKKYTKRNKEQIVKPSDK